jgi:UDP-3-O-[3-hydroxymyristoyl] glucosamine N-acyltransferase
MVTLIGKGGHAQDVHAIAMSCAVFVDRWIETTVPYEDGPYLLGMNDSQTRARLDSPAHSPALVHPSCSVAVDFTMSPGLVVGANTTIGPRTHLGRHTHINGNVFLTRAQLGDFVTVGPGVTICGDVVIGDRCQIGAGAVISNLCTIDPDTVVGAGAVVPPGSHLRSGTYVGNPVRCV